MTIDIDALKRAAVDADMCVSGGWELDGDTYRMPDVDWLGIVRLSTTGGELIPTVVEPRTPTISLGQLDDNELAEMSASLEVDLTNRWAEITCCIDELIERWDPLPPTQSLEDATTSACNLVNDLMGGGAAASGKVVQAGDLSTPVLSLLDYQEAIKGGALEDFKDRYLHDASGRATNITAVAFYIAQAASAEQEVWRQAKVGYAAIIDAFTTALRNQSFHGGGGGIPSVVWAVIGAALAGAKLVPGAVGVAAQAAGFITGLAQTLSAADEANPPSEEQLLLGSDVSESLNNLGKTLDKLDAQITAEERSIGDAMTASIADVRSSLAYYQLAAAPIYELRPGAVTVDPIADARLIVSDMTAASDAVAAAAKTVPDILTTMATALARPYGLSSRHLGAYGEIADGASVVKELLEEFAWDLARGSENLSLALNGYEFADDESARKAAELAAEIETGVTHDGLPPEDLLAPAPTNPGWLRIAQIME